MDMKTPEIAGKVPAKRGNPNWTKGVSGNPNGRAAVPPEVREALTATTLPRLATLERLATDAEDAGDLKTAAHIHLALLKKTVPDATELVISMPDGLNVRSITIDPRKLKAEHLAAVMAVQVAAKEEP